MNLYTPRKNNVYHFNNNDPMTPIHSSIAKSITVGKDRFSPQQGIIKRKGGGFLNEVMGMAKKIFGPKQISNLPIDSNKKKIEVRSKAINYKLNKELFGENGYNSYLKNNKKMYLVMTI